MKWIIHSFIITSLLVAFPIVTSANTTDIANQCDYTAVAGENPNNQTMNCLLTEVALQHDVPPEIVKAIAEVESSGWDHFDENGEAIISDDGGIGVMQITNQNDYDKELLKSDILYNIEAGVEILDQMYNRHDLPQINDMHRNLIEHWYFAVMAYNGTKPVNSPIVQATGETNDEAYQEKVFREIEEHNLIELSLPSFSSDDFDYDSDSSDNISFETTSYQTDSPATKSKHLYSKNSPVTVTASSLNVRESPTTDSSVISQVSANDFVNITDSFVYERNSNSENHFIWYPIELDNGQQGYVAGSYLKHHFKDVKNDHYAEEAIYYLTKRGYLEGKGDGKFGFNEDLTRAQTATLLNRANDISLENRPDIDFDDVPNDHIYYDHIAASVDEGYFDGKDNGEFGVYDPLWRAQMAIVLNRIYDIPEATGPLPFNDVPEDETLRQAVHNLYEAGITKGKEEGRFEPYGNVTREQFAAFLTRTIR